MSFLTRLTLSDFRSYGHAELPLTGGPVFLFGPNGAGKTNLLEAVSLLSPGRGLRNASAAELGRREPGEAQGRAWAVAAEVAGEHAIGTGLETPTASRRTVRLDGETVAPGRLAEFVRLVWLTPLQDRLFLEGAAERRRFFDRLVFAAEPAHAVNANAYDKAMRERTALLVEGPADPAWLNALEATMARAGALMSEARERTLTALAEEIDVRTGRPFPQAALSFEGEWARRYGEAELAQVLARGRMLDRRTEGADPQSGVGPGRPTFACRISAKPYTAARRSGGASGPLPARGPVR